MSLRAGSSCSSPASERSGGISVTVRAPAAVALALATGARGRDLRLLLRGDALVIVRLALLGGDAVARRGAAAALADLPEIALLAPAHSADADMLLAADSSLAAAGDLVRGERSRRAGRAVLLVAPAGAPSAAQQALECGAVGVVERPLDAPRPAARARGRRLLRRAPRCADAPRTRATSRCSAPAAAWARPRARSRSRAAHERAFVLDLALAMGDAADVAGVACVSAGRAAAHRLRPGGHAGRARSRPRTRRRVPRPAGPGACPSTPI